MPHPRLPQVGMPETKTQEAPKTDIPTESSSSRLSNVTKIKEPLTSKTTNRFPEEHRKKVCRLRSLLNF